MLHNLPKFKKRSQRVGRGGKRGTTAGRGTKGQKSRAGRKIRSAERDLIIRLPKRLGFGNKPKSPKPKIFNLKDLSFALRSRAKSGEFTLNRKFFLEAELLPSRYRGEIKILGDGEATIPMKVEGLKVSNSAKKKIEKAGGHIVDADTRR